MITLIISFEMTCYGILLERKLGGICMYEAYLNNHYGNRTDLRSHEFPCLVPRSSKKKEKKMILKVDYILLLKAIGK